MKLHFVGIGGIGMSALAQLCLRRGDAVSGSNLNTTTVWPQLEAAGAILYTDHQSNYLPDDADCLVYSEAIPEDNVERTKAAELNIPQKSYFAYLGEVLIGHNLIAVTGTHGKTTTTGMLAAGLVAADFPMTAVVGAQVPALEHNNFYHLENAEHPASSDQWTVVEACEYRNNFQYLDPEIVVLTNLELDHVDYYRDEDHYLQTFRDFCAKAKTVVCLTDQPLVDKVLDGYEGEIIRINPAGFMLDLDLPGAHNRSNAALALAAAEEIQSLNLKKFKKGLKHYQGAARRLEQLGEVNGLTVYDDYGHHPTEIDATLQALRERHSNQCIALIYEPHQYSRTREFFDGFAASFSKADHAGLYPIYAARDSEADKAAISRQHFIDQNTEIKRINDLEDAQNFAKKLPANSVLIFMGAGNISQLAHNFVQS